MSLLPFVSYGTLFTDSLASCDLGMIPCTILALFFLLFFFLSLERCSGVKSGLNVEVMTFSEYKAILRQTATRSRNFTVIERSYRIRTFYYVAIDFKSQIQVHLITVLPAVN